MAILNSEKYITEFLVLLYKSKIYSQNRNASKKCDNSE